MRKLIPLSLVFILCIVSVNSFAQRCAFEKDEVDGFTKETFKLTKRLMISKIPNWYLVMERKGSKYSITFSILALSEVRMVMTKGTKLLLKLEDGTMMEFTAENEVVPSFDVAGAIYTHWDMKVPVTEDQIKQFSKSAISIMRTTIGDKEYNMPDAHDRYTNKIMANAACMLEN